MPHVIEPVLATGLDAVVEQYRGHGPLLTAFLANLLATFGDKGQLVVITLAARYDAKRVFAGSMAAFGVWSALEVVFGAWVVARLPGDLITLVTGGLFVFFGVWTYVGVARRVRSDSRGPEVEAGMVDNRLARAVSARGGLVTSFVFIAVAEFGDKTQLLTINLAATFPDAPLAVFVGVVAALGLRTGIDAVLGAEFERRVPTAYLEAIAAGVFLAFGARILGPMTPLPTLPLWGLLVVPALSAVAVRYAEPNR